MNPTAEYAKECVQRPHLGGDAPVLAVWPDGFRCELDNIVQSEKWPKDYNKRNSAALPKTGKSSRGKNSAKENKFLWAGKLETGEPVHCQWRHSRGWQVSLYNVETPKPPDKCAKQNHRATRKQTSWT